LQAVGAEDAWIDVLACPDEVTNEVFPCCFLRWVINPFCPPGNGEVELKPGLQTQALGALL